MNLGFELYNCPRFTTPDQMGRLSWIMGVSEGIGQAKAVDRSIAEVSWVSSRFGDSFHGKGGTNGDQK